MVELRVHEQKILFTIEELGGKASVEQVMDASNSPDATVMGSALVLQEKNLLAIHAEQKSIIKLTREGEEYAKNGLPERRLIRAVAELGGSANLQEAAKKAGLEPQFIQIALGSIMRKKLAMFDSKTGLLKLNAEITPESPDEILLNSLLGKEADFDSLSKEQKDVVEALKKRKLLTVELKTKRVLQLTAEGQRQPKKKPSQAKSHS